MRIISTSYSKTPGYTDPETWLKHISFYTGILEELVRKHRVISFERISYDGGLIQNNVRYRFILFKKNKELFPWRMHREIKKVRPDIVLVNGLIFPLQVIQLRLKIGRKTKIIILHRAEKPFKGWKKILQKLADKCVDAYLFTSLEFKHQWKANINVSKIHEVIQASSVFRPMDRACAAKKTSVKGEPVYLWVGSLIPRKDPLTVVKAFLSFVQQYPGARLYMIYQQDDLLQEIKDLPGFDEDAIVFVGKISRDQLLYWYNSADFFISGSKYEGSGIAVSEAMSCGCVPLTTNFISFKAMLGDCGLMYETGNEKELLSVLKQTIHLDREKERLKTLKQFKKELSFEAIASKINAILSY